MAKALGRKLRLIGGAGPAWCVALSVVNEDRNLYSQAFVEHHLSIYAEVVSDLYLEGLGGPLSAQQRAALASAGWTDPAAADKGHLWPNWYRYFAGGSRWEEAADAMVIAVAAILGVSDSELLRLGVFPASPRTDKENVA